MVNAMFCETFDLKAWRQAPTVEEGQQDLQS